MKELSIRDHIFRNGLIYGLILIIWTMVSYFIGPSFMVSLTNLIIYFLVVMATATYSTVQWRKLNEGYVSFMDAFKVMILTVTVVVTLYSMFEYILYTLIDPQLTENIKAAALKQAEQWMISMGTPEDMIDEQMAKAEARMEGEHEMTLTNLFAGIGVKVILYALAALVVAAIVKKQKPVFEERSN